LGAAVGDPDADGDEIGEAEADAPLGAPGTSVGDNGVSDGSTGSKP
jgi:hypothetical protein